MSKAPASRRLFFLVVSVAATSQLACSHDSVDIRTLEPGAVAPGTQPGIADANTNMEKLWVEKGK